MSHSLSKYRKKNCIPVFLKNDAIEGPWRPTTAETRFRYGSVVYGCFHREPLGLRLPAQRCKVSCHPGHARKYENRWNLVEALVQGAYQSQKGKVEILLSDQCRLLLYTRCCHEPRSRVAEKGRTVVGVSHISRLPRQEFGSGSLAYGNCRPLRNRCEENPPAPLFSHRFSSSSSFFVLAR